MNEVISINQRIETESEQVSLEWKIWIMDLLSSVLTSHLVIFSSLLHNSWNDEYSVMVTTIALIEVG
jgi:hypothetical protein